MLTGLAKVRTGERIKRQHSRRMNHGPARIKKRASRAAEAGTTRDAHLASKCDPSHESLALHPPAPPSTGMSMPSVSIRLCGKGLTSEERQCGRELPPRD